MFHFPSSVHFFFRLIYNIIFCFALWLFKNGWLFQFFVFFFFHKKKTVWNFLNNPKLYLHNCVEIWWIWPFVLPKKKISRPSMTMISNQVNHIPTTRNIFCIRNTWHGMLWQKVELKFRIPILVLEIIWASNYSSQNLIPFPNSCENIRKIVYIYSILWTS